MERKGNKLKILYIHPSLSTGGAEELRFLVLKGLQQRNTYDIKVCCIESIGEIGEKIKNLGIEVFCLNKSSKPYNVAATLSLLKYLLINRFDIVQTSLFNANFHGRIAASLTAIPVIISEEHSEHYQYNSMKFLPYIWSDRILAKFTDKIICCSLNLMKSISKLENIPSSKLFPLLNTFDVNKLKNTKSALELREELGLSEKDLIIGNVASLSHRKGQDILLKVFKIIHDKFPSTRLIFIGSEVQEFKKNLLDLLHNLGLSGKVLFLGRRDNIADYLNIMDIFVLSSLFEGIPLSLLEAMYMQVPVVLTDVGGVSEVVKHNVNGILVEPDNIELLAAAIMELLVDKEKRIRIVREGKKTVMKQFNTEEYITRLENLYIELYRNRDGRLLRTIQ